MGHESQINRDYICFSFNHSHFQLDLYNLKSFTIFSSGGRFCEAKAKSKSQPNGTPLRWFSTTTRATSFHVKRCYTWNKARLFLKSFEKWQYFPHGKFPVDLESFQLIWKVSSWSGKFPDDLESFRITWKMPLPQITMVLTQEINSTLILKYIPKRCKTIYSDSTAVRLHVFVVLVNSIEQEL